jgi:hypothetical protein
MAAWCHAPGKRPRRPARSSVRFCRALHKRPNMTHAGGHCKNACATHRSSIQVGGILNPGGRRLTRFMACIGARGDSSIQLEAAFEDDVER